MDSDIAATARVTAAWRAVESAHASPLFDDPWAAALAGPELVARLAAQPIEEQDRASSYTVIRTRVIDDWLLSAAARPQIVLLGAGFDTRAFRLGWPAGIQVWELDRADVLGFKEAVLAGVQASSSCTRHTVAVDFADEAWAAALLGAGYRPDVPTAWVAEGVLPYLDPASVDTLLREVSGMSSAGSRFAADFVSADFMAVRNAYVAAMSQQMPTCGALFRFGVNDPSALLTHNGWQIMSLEHPGGENANFGRWAQPQAVGAGIFFVMAEPAGPR